MACVEPLTSSNGYLRLDYVHSTQSLSHSCRSRVSHTLDVTDVTTMRILADAWANVWKGIVTNAFVCASFSVLNPDGTLMYTAGLSGTITGVHTAAGGALDYASRTLCFTGRSLPAVAGGCSGEAIHRVFVGGGYEFIARQKFMVPGADAGVDAYATFLDTSADLFCDYYGNHAQTRGRYPVQFNAHGQKRNGT